jgi:hypothetical protein
MSKCRKNSDTKRRNLYVDEAVLLQRTAGGFHKDKREKRKTRSSWRKEIHLDY